MYHLLFVFVLQNELENFPLNTIQHCQAVMNACSYDSILALVCKESGQNKPDLHLFQCDHIKVRATCDWSCQTPQNQTNQMCPLVFYQANLIHADIESGMADAKGGKAKKRPEALR